MIDLVVIINTGSFATRWKRYSWPEVPQKGETIRILGLEESRGFPVIKFEVNLKDHMLDEGYITVQCFPVDAKDHKRFEALVEKDSSWRPISEEIAPSIMAHLRFEQARKQIA